MPCGALPVGKAALTMVRDGAHPKNKPAKMVIQSFAFIASEPSTASASCVPGLEKRSERGVHPATPARPECGRIADFAERSRAKAGGVPKKTTRYETCFLADRRHTNESHGTPQVSTQGRQRPVRPDRRERRQRRALGSVRGTGRQSGRSRRDRARDLLSGL